MLGLKFGFMYPLSGWLYKTRSLSKLGFSHPQRELSNSFVSPQELYVRKMVKMYLNIPGTQSIRLNHIHKSCRTEYNSSLPPDKSVLSLTCG